MSDVPSTSLPDGAQSTFFCKGCLENSPGNSAPCSRGACGHRSVRACRRLLGEADPGFARRGLAQGTDRAMGMRFSLWTYYEGKPRGRATWRTPRSRPSRTRALVGRTVADVERDLILETLKHCPSATGPMPRTSLASRSARCATSSTRRPTLACRSRRPARARSARWRERRRPFQTI